MSIYTLVESLAKCEDDDRKISNPDIINSKIVVADNEPVYKGTQLLSTTNCYVIQNDLKNLVKLSKVENTDNFIDKKTYKIIKNANECSLYIKDDTIKFLKSIEQLYKDEIDALLKEATTKEPIKTVLMRQITTSKATIKKLKENLQTVKIMIQPEPVKKSTKALTELNIDKENKKLANQQKILEKLSEFESIKTSQLQKFIGDRNIVIKNVDEEIKDCYGIKDNELMKILEILPEQNILSHYITSPSHVQQSQSAQVQKSQPVYVAPPALVQQSTAVKESHLHPQPAHVAQLTVVENSHSAPVEKSAQVQQSQPAPVEKSAHVAHPAHVAQPAPVQQQLDPLQQKCEECYRRGALEARKNQSCIIL